jgi:predicted RNase H-like nuclease (RuvC/YqgF family)
MSNEMNRMQDELDQLRKDLEAMRVAMDAADQRHRREIAAKDMEIQQLRRDANLANKIRYREWLHERTLLMNNRTPCRLEHWYKASSG